MLNRNYYYIVAGLPDLFFENKGIGISSLDFKKEIRSQIHDQDYELCQLLYLEKNNQDLVNLLYNSNEPKNQDKIESVSSYKYISNLLKWREEHEDVSKFEFEKKLYTNFYGSVLQTSNSFLQKWFNLKLNIKNILTAFNCLKFNYPLEKHLIKLPQNAEVYTLLVNKQLKPEYFEDDVPMAKQIFSIAESDLNVENKEKQIDRLLWNYAEELSCYTYVSVEKILSFIIKLMIVERLEMLDDDIGQNFLDKIIEDLKLSDQLAEDIAR